MIDTIKNEELKIKQEDLLKNMKMLRHTVADMLGSKSFLKGLAPGAQNGLITVNEEQFPIYITANTLAADGLPEITDDIFDEENYLSLVSDDDLMWYALVEHLAHQAELLQNENNQLREDLTAADNEINELEEDRKETNKKCSEYVKEIDKLTVDNKRLSERVKTLVIEKSGKLEKSDDTTEEPASEIVKECVDKPDLAEKYEELQEKNRILRWSYNNLRSVFNSTYGVSVANHDDMQKTITKETFAELTARINELEEENDSIKKKNDELLDYNTKLRQEITKLRVDTGLSVADSVNGIQEISSILEPHIVNANDDMKYIITYKALNEVTERIKELEATLKDKDGCIDQLSKNNAALSVENKNISDLLREADRNVRFYVREVDNLEKQISDLQSKALSDGEDIIDENHDNKPEKFGEATRAGEAFAQSIEMDMETAMLLQENAKLKEQIENIQKDNEDFERVAAAHLETTTKFSEYKERQKRLYKHFRNLAEMIEDLMEME